MLDESKLSKLKQLFATLPDGFLQQLGAALKVGGSPLGRSTPAIALLVDEELTTRQPKSGAAFSLNFQPARFSAATPMKLESVSGIKIRDESASPEKVVEPETVVAAVSAPEPMLDPTAMDEPATADQETPLIEEPPASQPQARHQPLELGAVMLKPRNAMHAFFGPLEGLIIDAVHYAPRQEGTLASTSLPSIWRLLNEEAGSSAIRDAWMNFERAGKPDDADMLEKLLKRLHNVAENTIRTLAKKAGKEPGYRRSLIMRLGGEAIYGDMLELGLMLPNAIQLGRLYRALVSTGLAQDNARPIADHILAMATSSSNAAKYGFGLFLAKLWNPVLALSVQAEVNQLWVGQSNPYSAELEDVVPMNLITRLDRQSVWLERQTSLDGMDDSVLSVFKNFAVCCYDIASQDAAIVSEDIAEAAKNHQRKARSFFDRLTEQATTTVCEALPASAQDIGRDPGAVLLMERAVTAANFIGSSSELTQRLTKGDALASAKQHCSEALESTVTILERVTRPGGNDAHNREAILEIVEQLTALAERLQQPSAAREMVARLEAVSRAA